MRSDLPRCAARAARVGHQLRRHSQTRSPRAIKNRSKDPDTCRQSSSAQTRSPSKSARPAQHAHRSRGPDRDRLFAGISPVAAATAAIVCERLCVSAPSTIISPRPLPLSLKWTSGGHGLLGALPRSYQVTPDIPDRRRATQQKEVRPARVDSLKESQLAAGRDLLLGVGHHRRRRITTASLKAEAEESWCRLLISFIARRVRRRTSAPAYCLRARVRASDCPRPSRSSDWGDDTDGAAHQSCPCWGCAVGPSHAEVS